jgi:hypothetical protein
MIAAATILVVSALLASLVPARARPASTSCTRCGQSEAYVGSAFRRTVRWAA